ncbi:monocarboxylate transporter 7-like isoform X3 [Periplaneta americana]|uniref:monocarboxylate transporter 7-like isoform X3 n=1 Tax=Periplaneta americana TaxID=6978 RepID=UPI0037E8D22B
MALRSKEGRRERLMLDTVIGSQPELGPAPPDGGYGWVILFGVLMIQVTIPSILTTSGLLICHILNESISMSVQNTQWIWLPAIYCAAWNLADPWSLTLTSIMNGCCMAVIGIILVASSLLAAGLIPSSVDYFYISLGLFAGIGASMATTQSDFLLHKFFRARFPLVYTLRLVGEATGEILMPILIGNLLDNFGLCNTLLLQAGITLQALIGAVLFRRPRYVLASQESTTYTLLQNEDAEENTNNETPNTFHSQKATEKILQDTEPSKNTNDSSDEEQYTEITNTEAPKSFMTYSSPTIDSNPRPLFSDIELAENSQNTAFFIEDSDDDVDLYVQRGGFTKKTIPCIQELKVLGYPSFYCWLILTVITKMSSLAFWILLPLLMKFRLKNFHSYHAIMLLSIGGTANFCTAIGAYWLPTMSAKHRKFVFITAAFVTAGGLYASNFETSFTIMAWIQIAAGLLWCLQPICNRICSTLL